MEAAVLCKAHINVGVADNNRFVRSAAEHLRYVKRSLRRWLVRELSAVPENYLKRPGGEQLFAYRLRLCVLLVGENPDPRTP